VDQLYLNDLNLLNVIQFLKENYSVNLSLSYDKDKIKTRRKLQHLFSNRFKDHRSQMIYEMILSHISHAEMRCATAGQLLLSKITGNCEAVTRNIHTRDDVLMALESMGIKKILRDIMAQVLDIASTSTKISLKQAVNSNFYIELILGHCFSVTPLLPISIHRQYSKIHILCVDGYIENVSEFIAKSNSISSDFNIPIDSICLTFGGVGNPLDAG
jgi:hypothetical protein